MQIPLTPLYKERKRARERKRGTWLASSRVYSSTQILELQFWQCHWIVFTAWGDDGGEEIAQEQNNRGSNKDGQTMNGDSSKGVQGWDSQHGVGFSILNLGESGCHWLIQLPLQYISLITFQWHSLKKICCFAIFEKRERSISDMWGWNENIFL